MKERVIGGLLLASSGVAAAALSAAYIKDDAALGVVGVLSNLV